MSTATPDKPSTPASIGKTFFNTLKRGIGAVNDKLWDSFNATETEEQPQTPKLVEKFFQSFKPKKDYNKRTYEDDEDDLDVASPKKKARKQPKESKKQSKKQKKEEDSDSEDDSGASGSDSEEEQEKEDSEEEEESKEEGSEEESEEGQNENDEDDAETKQAVVPKKLKTVHVSNLPSNVKTKVCSL